jgi:hypothetical protein
LAISRFLAPVELSTLPVVIERIPNRQLISWQWLKTEDAIKQELARV